MKHIIELSIPFNNDELADQAMKVISVDKELRDKELTRTLYIEENETKILKAKFESDSKKMLRVSINSFLDLLALIKETQANFILSR